MDLELNKQRTKGLRTKYSSKLGNITELKEKYYIGSNSALHLVKQNQGSLDLEQKLKEEISKHGISSNFCPSYLELDELKVCIRAVFNSIDSSIQGEHKRFAGNYLPMKDYKNLFEKVRMPSEELLLREFAFNRARSVQLKENKSTAKVFMLTLKNYFPKLISQYSEFFKEIKTPLKSAFTIAINKISRNIEKLQKGDFKGQLEAGNLEHVSISGCRYSDVLYDRLEREQVLYRDEMQKTYLTRFIAERNIKDYQDFLDAVQMNIEQYQDDSEEKIEEKEYLRLISNRHKNWVKKFLES